MVVNIPINIIQFFYFWLIFRSDNIYIAFKVDKEACIDIVLQVQFFIRLLNFSITFLQLYNGLPFRKYDELDFPKMIHSLDITLI